jgi:hypothetical protein
MTLAKWFFAKSLVDSKGLTFYHRHWEFLRVLGQNPPLSAMQSAQLISLGRRTRQSANLGRNLHHSMRNRTTQNQACSHNVRLAYAFSAILLAVRFHRGPRSTIVHFKLCSSWEQNNGLETGWPFSLVIGGNVRARVNTVRLEMTWLRPPTHKILQAIFGIHSRDLA